MEQHGSSDTASYFFKLPREIRDQTYGYLAREEKLALNKPSYLTCFWIQGYTRMSYRLVSRRFGREYREQLQRTMVLHIELRTDTSSCFQNDLKRPGRSIIYGNVRHVVVNFVKTETNFRINHQQFCEQILPSLPRTQKVEMVHAINSIDHSALPLVDRAVAIFFSLPVNFDCDLVRYMTIASPLFCHRMASGFPNGSRLGRFYDSDLTRFPHNWITFRGTPDNGPFAWRGLALEVHEEPDRKADEQYVKRVNESYAGSLDPQWML